eukprot:COSAG06_NODE_53394_length_300_cov_0.905473_1_plen_77_part_01
MHIAFLFSNICARTLTHVTPLPRHHIHHTCAHTRPLALAPRPPPPPALKAQRRRGYSYASAHTNDGVNEGWLGVGEG